MCIVGCSRGDSADAGSRLGAAAGAGGQPFATIDTSVARGLGNSTMGRELA